MGSKEEKSNKARIKKVFNGLKTKNKKFVIIKRAHHTMRTSKEIKPFIKECISWLKNLDYEN